MVPSVRAHPIARFLEAGIPVVVSSDDPDLFGIDLLHEYDVLHREAGIPLFELGRCAAASFEHALVEPSDDRDRLDGWRREAWVWAEGAR